MALCNRSAELAWLNAARANRSLLDRQMERTANKGKGFRALSPSQREGPVQVTEPISVKSLSGDLGIKSSLLQKALMTKHGIFATANQSLSAEQAVSMIVSGFCKEVFRELPMEFAVEAQKLLGISLEGSVG